MIILRKYKSVVFWLIFMSLWIIGCDTCCKDDDDETEKDDNTSWNNGINNFNYTKGNVNNYNSAKNIDSNLNPQDNMIKESSNNINDDFTNQNTEIVNLSNKNLNDYNNNSINNGNNMTTMNNHPMSNNKQWQIINQYLIDNNINITCDTDMIDVLYKKQNPPNVGLNNVGATCFMNSTLQCLSHTKRLTNYFLNPRHQERIIKNNIAIKNPNNLQLAPLYLELILELWGKSGQKNYHPYNFVNRFQSMNPLLFKEGQAGDAKDFIIFFLQQIHEELKKTTEEYKESNVPLNPYNKEDCFNNFFNGFQKETSIISDTFFGVNETTNICCYCQEKYSSEGQQYPICYNYGTFNCIIFPLGEVKKMKNDCIKLYNIRCKTAYPPTNKVTLTDCFLYDQKTTIFTDDRPKGGFDKRFYCSFCKQNFDSKYKTHIYSAPNVLILILNRGKDNTYDVKIDFDHILEITDFVQLNDNKQKILYKLYGVITHMGQSGPYAHFVASCKSPVDGNWYSFNDNLVLPIYDFKKEVHDFATPYVLFYEKIEEPQNMIGM